MQLTRKCHGCGQDIRKDEMIQYTTLSGKTSYWFCKDCYEERMARERFQNKVCQIFGTKSPGPQIWTERKRLREKYGYTDSIIIDCLDYIYNVEKIKKESITLYFVTPTMVEKMRQWKREEQQKNNGIIAAYQTKYNEYIVPIKENNTSNKTNWNPDDWLYVD